MINLPKALAEDIAAGMRAAQNASDLPQLEQEAEVVVQPSGRQGQGDYASPVALGLAKKLNKKPREVVEVIVKHMEKKEYIGKLEVAEPGFLNIWINPGWLTARLDDIIEQDIYSEIELGMGEHYNFEFISANPTGPMTLGNMRTAFTVDTLARVLERAGFNITREYYINDYGEQIKKLGESVVRRVLQSRGEKIDYPAELYQGDYIAEVGQNVAEELSENEGKELTVEDLTDEEVIDQVGKRAAHLLLVEIKRAIEEDLKIRIDVWTSERQLREEGKVDEVLERLRAKGATYKKEEAEYLKTTEFGDSEDRILVKSDGGYAYITPDIAYHQDKYDRKFDLIFTFVGADHQGHAPKLMAAMEALGNDISKLKVVAAQMMHIVQGGKPVKLSKRAGTIIEPKDLINEVGYDAARFFMVQHALTTHMEFDLELAREESERNPVYYVQYAHVRLQSILRKAKQEGALMELGVKIELTSHAELTRVPELKLMRQLYRFPEVIDNITQTLEVQALAYYAHDLARAIHHFYKHTRVLQEEDEDIRRSRLQLVLASRTVLGRVLDLLGISKPDVM